LSGLFCHFAGFFDDVASTVFARDVPTTLFAMVAATLLAGRSLRGKAVEGTSEG